MKRRNKKLLKAFKHEQVLILKCLDIIHSAYQSDSTASDEGGPGKLHVPSVHDTIKPVEAVTQLQEQYR